MDETVGVNDPTVAGDEDASLSMLRVKAASVDLGDARM
jgi:hypothetical protein